MTAPPIKFPRLGPLQVQLLKTLGKYEHGMSTDDVAALRLFEDSRQHMRSLESMAASGLLKWRRQKRTWAVTPRGRAMLRMLDARAPEPKYVGVKVPPRLLAFEGTYDGAELRPQQARPGGNTHTTIPSLIGGQRVMRG
jgi:hypothetical protein